MRFLKTGLAIVCGLILTATGLWAGGESDSDSDGSMPAATDKETVFDPASGQTWTAPEYGGTLTWAPRHYPVNADVWSGQWLGRSLLQWRFGADGLWQLGCRQGAGH